MKLADMGHFWVGLEHKKMPYGTVLAGQMYVQYMIPAQVRHPYPIVLVHGGGGSMLHYMGIGEQIRVGALLRAGRISSLSRRSSGPRSRAVSS